MRRALAFLILSPNCPLGDGTSQLHFTDEEIEAQKPKISASVGASPVPQVKPCPAPGFLLQASCSAPPQSPVDLYLARGVTAMPLLPSPHITFLVCCPLPVWLC